MLQLFWLEGLLCTFFKAKTVRKDRSKQGRAQKCLFLKHRVSTGYRSIDVGMVCPARMWRAIGSGCLMKGNTAAAVPVQLFCCSLKAKAVKGEGKKEKTTLRYTDAKTCRYKISGTIAVVPVLSALHSLCIFSMQGRFYNVCKLIQITQGRSTMLSLKELNCHYS